MRGGADRFLARPGRKQATVIKLGIYSTCSPLTFLIRVRAIRDPLRGELPRVQVFMNDGPNPLT